MVCVNLYPDSPETPMNDHDYTYGTTRNDTDSATEELQFRQRPQSNMTHPKFKQFKLVVALSWSFQIHQDSSQITKVLLPSTPMSLRCYYNKNHADASQFDKSG